MCILEMNTWFFAHKTKIIILAPFILVVELYTVYRSLADASVLVVVVVVVWWCVRWRMSNSLASVAQRMQNGFTLAKRKWNLMKNVEVKNSMVTSWEKAYCSTRAIGLGDYENRRFFVDFRFYFLFFFSLLFFLARRWRGAYVLRIAHTRNKPNRIAFLGICFLKR